MNVAGIRGFLLVHPKPSTVRVHTVGGEVKDIKAGNFAKTADTVAALDPDLIECLDKEGGLIRARRVGGTAVNPSDDPPLPQSLENDPGAAQIALFARLIAKAYEHSTEVAFTKLVEVFERLDARSESIERRLERAEAAHRRAVEDQLEAELDRAEAAREQAEQGGGSMQEQMASAFLASAMPGMGGAPAPTPTNGKPGPARSRNGASPTNGKGHD